MMARSPCWLSVRMLAVDFVEGSHNVGAGPRLSTDFRSSARHIPHQRLERDDAIPLRHTDGGGIDGDREGRGQLQSAAPRQQEPRKVLPEGLDAAERGWRRPASCHEKVSCRELQALLEIGTATAGRRCQCRAVAPASELSPGACARARVGDAVVDEGVQEPGAFCLHVVPYSRAPWVDVRVRQFQRMLRGAGRQHLVFTTTRVVCARRKA